MLRERAVLRGCLVGRLALDPEIVGEGIANGELPANLDPAATATALVAVLQGGYVLACSSGTVEPVDQAIRGALALFERR